MKRFIAISLAALLGLVSAAEVQSPQFLVDADDIKKVSCFVYADFSVWDLKPLYADAGYKKGDIKINFCKPFDTELVSADGKKKLQSFSVIEKSGEANDVRYSDNNLIPKEA